MPTSEAAFGKGGISHLRKTGRHIAFLTLEQMCRLFYLKRAIDNSWISAWYGRALQWRLLTVHI